MSDDKKLLSHEYDGIRELDNHLPKWWLQILYASIIFSVGYMIYYHAGGSGLSPSEEFEAEVRPQLEAAKTAVAMGPSEAEVNTKLLAMVGNSEALKSGAKVYVEKCQVCHAPGGAGLIGPNLTDDYWLHGGKGHQIVHVIINGVPEKGMVPWGSLLSMDEIYHVAAYIQSLRGTSPANAKAPQGDLVKTE